MKLNKGFVLVLCFAFAMMFVANAFAQETTAGLQGTVKDQQGAVVANAIVELTSPALIGKKTAKTDSAGNFSFSALPPGSYDLTVTAQNFRTHKQTGIDLSAGRLPIIDIALQVGSVGETIEVSSEAPQVDVTSSKVSVSVTHEELQNIPKGRSFQSLIPFAPGARQEPLQGARNDRSNGFQIDGASDSENVYLIDGVNTTNIANGGVGKSFQTDFIQEVQIKSSSFEAEYGGALGGVINAVPKRGSNAWHGELKAYYQSSALDANDPCGSGYTASVGPAGLNGGSLTCGQRLLPGTTLTGRFDGTPDYLIPRKDNRHTIEPGFDLGGPLFKDKLWLYSGYIPTIDTTKRTTNFTAGTRTLTNSFIQHNMYNRLDYKAFNSLSLFGSWNYAYSRSTGQLGSIDSAIGQANPGDSVDPNTLRGDNASVFPLQVFSFGGDWSPTSKLVVTSRYGYFFNNTSTRGTPVGIRYIYDGTVNASSHDLSGATVPSTGTGGVNIYNGPPYTSIPSNFATVFDAYKRKSWTLDGSYFLSHALGTHTLKGGFFWAGQENNVNISSNTAVVNLEWFQDYSPVTSATACDAIKAQNLAQYGTNACTGKYGYFFTGSTTTSNTGSSQQSAKALYVQDAWTVGHGLTLNLGLRFDEETQPPYDPARFPSVHFGWGDKIAPRIGGAYDLFHNGKVKLYGSYGQFYDIMKMGLARGSFGSDYWHECIYAMDSYDWPTFTVNGGPSAPGGCPASGPATGIPASAGRFIENVDFRATKADPRDPAIQPNMKPMKQHELVFGVDWAISPNWALETRYSRKRLDNTIEDMAITDNLGFYIGNPGSTFAGVLHRPTVIPCGPASDGFACTPDAAGNYLNTTPFCAECPATIPAVRNYDGVEFRLSRRPGSRWYGSVSYTYSKLTGNYAGLTNTDPTDGNGGRHSPNNNRAFDIPTMTYLPNGKLDDGPLSTDRPNTVKAFGYYRLKWLGMESNIGMTQSIFQGTPKSTCLPVVGTSSACQWAEGRGNFVNFTRAANGDFVVAGIDHGARTPAYLQTDFILAHEIKVSKNRESNRLIFEANVYNLFNQHSAVGYNEIAVAGSGLISPSRAKRFSGDPGIDWNKVMTGYNYVDAVNGNNTFAGIQSPLALASRYGLPSVFQIARQVRLAVRFQF